MGRPTSPRPTDAELDVLHVLWEAGDCTIRDVQNGLAQSHGRNLGLTTVQKALEIMVDKGLVAKAGEERPAKFSAKVRRAAVEKLFLRHLAERVFGRSLVGFVMRSAPLLKASPEEVEQLQQYLAELKSGAEPSDAGPEGGGKAKPRKPD